MFKALIAAGDKISKWLAIIISISALVLTLYFQYWQEAKLHLGVGQVLLLNAKPRIGLLLSIYNSGANSGNVLSGSLLWGNVNLTSRMVSPQLETWRFTPGGKRETVADTTFSYIPATTIPPHGSQPIILWFVADTGEKLFTAGDHPLTISLYDGIHANPVATSCLTLHLDYKDVQDIYDVSNSSMELPVPWKDSN